MDRWGGFVATALALWLCFTTSSLPTPIYPLYQSEWGIPPSALTYIFTAYMVGVLPALICFGRISDTIGRFRVVLTSLCLLMAGLIISALAPNVAVLALARFMIGFGNGLLTTAGAAALAESHPERDRHVAAVVTSAAISIAFGLGPVLGGALAQAGWFPLVLPYVAVLIGAAFNLVLLVRHRAMLQGPFGRRVPLSIRPQMALPTPAKRPSFLLACAAGFATFAVGSFFASLVPSALRQVLPWAGPLVVGGAFLLMAIASTFIQFVQRGIAPFKGLALGMLGFAVAVGLLALGLALHDVLVLALGMVFVGVGQGYGFMSAAVIAGLNADEHRRTANMSTYFLSSYMGATAPVIGVGLLADKIGLSLAVDVYAAAISALLVVLALLAWRQQGRQAAS